MRGLLKWLTLLGMVIAIILAGTVFFRVVEGWSWIDSYFFTVVTLSTVGYGNLVPATVLGKIGTTVFILLGLGVFAVAIQQFGALAMRKREEHTEWLIGMLHHGEPPADGRQAPRTGPETTPPEEDGPQG